MKAVNIAVIILVVLLFGSYPVRGVDGKMEKQMNDKPRRTKTAVFAGGCFWCTESDFEKVGGVIEAISGYTDGHVANPTYKQVSRGVTGHVEAVKVFYDPAKVSYDKLLEVFWRHVDPTDGEGQFVDRGSQYRSAIFYANEQEHRLAETSKRTLAASGRFNKPIATDILPLGTFYPAGDYHQDYYKRNSIRYRWYRYGSGRDQFLEKVWANMKSVTSENMKETGMPKESMKEEIDGEMPSEMKTGG
jgi:peptide methionine sulfoxide reductase msrA/msrB